MVKHLNLEKENYILLKELMENVCHSTLIRKKYEKTNRLAVIVVFYVLFSLLSNKAILNFKNINKKTKSK